MLGDHVHTCVWWFVGENDENISCDRVEVSSRVTN